MRHIWHSLFLILGLSLVALPVRAQKPPVCDVVCAPDPTSSTYTGGTVQARTATRNIRGRSTVLAATSAVTGAAANVPAPVIAGSQTYNYAVPILSLAGRNGLDVSLVLFYNSGVWTLDSVNNRFTFDADRDSPSYGFRLSFGLIEGLVPNSLGLNGYLLTEPDGSKRELRLVSGTTYESADSTYMDYNSSTGILYRKDGSQWLYQAVPGTSTFFRPIQIKDTNGNFISISYSTAQGANNQAIDTITDTLGRQIHFVYDSSNRLTSITAPAFGGVGTTTVATFGWAQIPLNFNFTLSVPDTLATGSSINVLTSCTYPNGTGYRFLYGDWGIVKEIDRMSASPTSAVRNSVSYDYPLATTALSDLPAFTHQSVFDGINTGTWTYQVTKSSGLVTASAITNPSNTTTTTTNFANGGWASSLVSSVVTTSGSTTLRMVTQNWIQDNVSVYVPTNPRLSSVVSTLNDTGAQSQALFSYTTYGNVNQVQEYDFGPLLARTTQTDYITGSTYINQHILGLPSQVRVYDGYTGSLVSRTDIAYDGGILSSISGAPQHDDSNYGSTFATRGNLSTVTQYPNLPNTTSAIARTSSYDTLGNTISAQVSCCQLKQWTFSTTTGYAYPDQLKRGLSTGTQLTTSWTYDYNTGALLSETDPNQQTTSYSYDTALRLTGVTRPLGANTALSFDDQSAQPVTTTTSVLDASNNSLRIATTDGAGRPLKTETKSQSGAGDSVVDAQYDALGRVTQTSNPHAPNESPVWTTNAYDALGRITSVTPPGSAGSSQYSYSGNATTVTDPAGKQRRTIADALGRLVQVHEAGYSDGVAGSGYVDITGSEQCKRVNIDGQFFMICNQGNISITVDRFTAATTYASGSTSSGIAGALANQFNSNPTSPVTASTGGGSRVTLIAKFPGPQGNYSLSVFSNTTDNTGTYLQTSFPLSPSGSALTGGSDGTSGGQPSINTPLVTVYSYDPLDNLKLVVQGVQHRQYTYDGVGRLLTAYTPEAGTLTNTYTDFGQVATRTDARGVVASYSYDTLNRTSQVSYNVGSTGVPATPLVNFTYDQGGSSAFALGALTSMTDGVGSETYQYDQLGRITQMTKTIAGTAYSVAYQYNLAGELVSVTYPSNRVVQQAYDSVGRLAQIQSGGTNLLTINSNNYNSAYLPTLATYGNGVQATFSYNSRLQLASIAYAQGSSAYFSQNYSYTSQGVPGNNGQIQSITDNVDATRSTAYTYDAWSRLKTATNAQWGLTYTYDRYGNRKSQSAPVLNNVTLDPYTNRLLDTGYAYDAAGNMTADGLNSLTYDAANRLVTNTQAGVVTNYTYDGNSLRVKKCAPNCTSPTSRTVYIFSGSKVIAEYDNGAPVGSPTREYIYSGGALLATIDASGTKYHHADHLSPRVTTDSNGTKISEQGHFPFGESWYETGTATKWKFTTYERDAESLNDYALARYNVNRLGRFSSPDPVGGSLADPQSLNRYAYVLNDPVNLGDPSGLDPFPLQPSSAFQIRVQHVRRSTTFLAFLPAVDLLRLLYAEFAPGWFSSQGPARVNGDPGDLSKLIGPPKLPPPPPGYEECMEGLAAAGTTWAAVERANAAMSTLIAVTAGKPIDWTMLAAVGIRESGFLNRNQTNGQGVGIFQIDLGKNPSVTAAQASNPVWAANWAANRLAANYGKLGEAYPNFDPAHLLQATAASYNFGRGNISGNPNTIDVGSTGNNYGSNIMNLMYCFH